MTPERVKAYIENVKFALQQLESQELGEGAREVVELARSYLSDSIYYLERGDAGTALSCIAYAEGLLDALRFLGIAKLEWKPLSSLLKRPKVLVAGSFEVIHPGHIHLLRRAWELGDTYVVVARDINFEKFKGRKPVVSEADRARVVGEIRYVTRAILGDESDLLKPVEEIKPDIILLGPDQWANEEELVKKLAERGLANIKVMRLNEKYDNYSASKILERARDFLCK